MNISILKNCSTYLNAKQKCALISIDLRKAFDLVDHNILMQKLKSYGCDGKSLKWFKSYLDNRFQFVVYNNHISDVKKTRVGVPQGSCLAPLLFSIFINDITKLNLNGILYLFADDMNLVVSAKTYIDLETKINSDLYNINNWFKKHRLVPNLTKSNYMIMGCPPKSVEMNVILGNRPLKRVFDSKVLGVTFDHDLRFESHINNICKKISQRISFISRLRYIVPQHVTNLVFKSLVLPIFDYCDIVWCFTYEKHLKKLDILQKRAARVITFSNINENTEELIRTLNWLPTRKRFEFHTLCYIFKALNKLGSNVSSNYFEIVTKFSQRTGDSLKLKLPNI